MAAYTTALVNNIQIGIYTLKFILICAGHQTSKILKFTQSKSLKIILCQLFLGFYKRNYVKKYIYILVHESFVILNALQTHRMQIYFCLFLFYPTHYIIPKINQFGFPEFFSLKAWWGFIYWLHFLSVNVMWILIWWFTFMLYLTLSKNHHSLKYSIP